MIFEPKRRKGKAMPNAKDVARFVREGMRDKTSAARLAEIVKTFRRNEVGRGMTPGKLVALLEDLGPTFIKLGQILSARSDMLPQEYCTALQSLRSSTTPEPFEAIAARLNDAYGGDYREVFASIDEEPLGSASIAQVHRAVLRKNGREVAVKVRRHHVREDMLRDIQLMRRAADLLNLTGVPMMGSVMDGMDMDAVIDEFDRTVREEIDFGAEARNLQRFGSFVGKDDGITCPRVYREYSGDTVLVMEFVRGVSVEDVGSLRACGYDLKELGDRIAGSYMRQMVEEGFYHADPHSANLIVRPALRDRAGDACDPDRPDANAHDPGEVVWIDCGMMGELSPHERTLFLEMMKAMVYRDEHRLTDLFIEWGSVSDAPGKRLNYGQLLQDLTRLVDRYSAEDVNSMDLAALLNDIMKILESAHVSMPQSFVMLVRGLATLQGMLITLTPEISILAVVDRYVRSYAFRSFDPFSDVTRRVREASKAGERIVELPVRVSNVLDMVEKGRLRMSMDFSDASEPMRLLSYIIDRMSLSMITAGLFIGSSIIYATGLEPQLFGVPVIGFLGFLGAAFLSIYIIWNIHRRPRG